MVKPLFDVHRYGGFLILMLKSTVPQSGISLLIGIVPTSPDNFWFRLLALNLISIWCHHIIVVFSAEF
jgi:hypothetical protein